MGIKFNQDIQQQIQDSINIRNLVINDTEMIDAIVNLSYDIAKALSMGNKVFFAGNGGSFSDAQHLAAEFVGRFLKEREPLSAICLGANISSTTAIGNDYGFNQVFSRELKALSKQGDILIAISTSGHSENILELVENATYLGVKAFSLIGKDGGSLKNISIPIIIPSQHTARIQEMHITIGHIICDLVDKILPTLVNQGH